ncbi:MULTISPECIES: phosphoglycolate phosphatase [Pantoea]|jgi:phosphoglycolate phosphatase|uniref:Phosphoglycolate phosphatase n=1 Tax=Pantoea brenneri TaxID=472694 RepID=A0A653NUI5_9GAMM|nr:MULTISPECIES: phosphoglycolate phosphatase [Pantoea]KKD31112.1 phosphoglycolate phosphatase [Pantoea sp. 3.5.1]MBS6034507.1 phosphoglycolate phosphatase [Pantoea sp.]MBZ6396336.1 phosphoglycolate phosphatase [Pantoea sp.]MBZ6439700.1 phosphoglycolate phosphatase [Pantoea sp.]MCQ5471886.1 phosphoglycolate phosphatase [Pantoea brenneri]
MAHFTDIRALAFDLDGTLVDSAPGLAEAIDRTLKDLSLPVAGLERVSTWIGNGADIMMSRALTFALGREPQPDEQHDARALFDKHYADTVDAGSTLFPQVKQTLAALQATGLPLAIVTNKPTPFVAPLLQSLGIAEAFSLIIGGDDVPVKKPHPAAIFLVLGTFGVLPDQLLFVGDSRNDIQAAQAAGVPNVGMTYGYNYGESIASSQPNVTLDSFDQLLPALGL